MAGLLGMDPGTLARRERGGNPKGQGEERSDIQLKLSIRLGQDLLQLLTQCRIMFRRIQLDRSREVG